MRRLVLALSLLCATPVLAQFPPPGIYACSIENGPTLGTLSLLVAGDYQWDSGGETFVGQIASSGTSLEAITGVLAEAHWKGTFVTEADATTFSFASDSGTVVCR